MYHTKITYHELHDHFDTEQSFDAQYLVLREILLRRLALLSTSTILAHMFLRSVLVSLELCDLGRVHVLHDVVCLPLLECEAESLMTVVLVVCLILVVFYLDEVGVYCVGVERQRD